MLKRAMVVSGLVWAFFPLVAHAQLEYRVDDGRSEEAVGIDSTRASHALAWLNLFTGEIGKPEIVAVKVAFGRIPTGTFVTVYIWSFDPVTGLPNIVLRSASGVIGANDINTSNTNRFKEFPLITTLDVTLGQKFFVGAIINDYPGGIAGGNPLFVPAKLDTNGLDDPPDVFLPNNHSYIAGMATNAGAAMVDPNNLPGAQIALTLVGNTPLGDGNWLVRAVVRSGACCDPAGACSAVVPSSCTLPSTYQGDGTECLGDLNADGIDDACQSIVAGACCEPNGACSFATQGFCTNILGGTWNGVGTQCQGDGNGNGIDDACEPGLGFGFNIDVNLSGRPVPPGTSGAVAGQPGVWNSISFLSFPPNNQILEDVGGNVTSVGIETDINWQMGALGAGATWDPELMNDHGLFTQPQSTITVTDLPAGTYDIYVYSFSAGGPAEDLGITIGGVTKTIQGPGFDPGGQVQGQTWEVFTGIAHPGGNLPILLDRATSSVGLVNGLQITAVVLSPPCVDCNDCVDGDECTCDLCVAGLCDNPPRLYGDIDCNGIINIFDLLQVLSCFAGTCNVCFSDIDISPCSGNGTINIFDLLGVLGAFAGNNACSCPAGP